MRQGQQQNRRGRGRGGRKGQNPLSRSFESSGPDIKIRGTAQHIAEKYMALARDAIGSGDLVLGENYLQHAEHYNRIIMAAQTAVPGSTDQNNGNGQRIARPEGDLVDGMGDGYDGDDEGDGEGDRQGANGGNYEQPRQFDGNGQREPQQAQQSQHNQHFNQQQPRNRDSRNFDNRNYDNRRNDNRHFEPRGQGGNDQRGHYEPRGRANQDQRGQFEPRHQEQPRQPAPNGDQPRSFDVQPPQMENNDTRPPVEGKPSEGVGARGRRRRGRNDNGTTRLYPPPGQDLNGSQPNLNEADLPESPRGVGSSDSGSEGQD